MERITRIVPSALVVFKNKKQKTKQKINHEYHITYGRMLRSRLCSVHFDSNVVKFCGYSWKFQPMFAIIYLNQSKDMKNTCRIYLACISNSSWNAVIPILVVCFQYCFSLCMQLYSWFWVEQDYAKMIRLKCKEGFNHINNRSHTGSPRFTSFDKTG